MKLFPVVKSRAFADLAQPALGLAAPLAPLGEGLGGALAVRSCRWNATGGPARAVLAGGVPDLQDLDALLGLLRCPLELWTESGALAWWGCVWSVQIFDGSLALQASLDQLANRVRVAYADLAPESQGAGRRATTAWLDDALSQAAVGIKEAQVDLVLATPAQAEAWRGIRLAQNGRLQFTPDASSPPKFRPGGGPAGVIVTARGWWDTLDWKFYASSAGLVQNIVRETQSLQTFGQAGFSEIGTSFSTPLGGWRADHAWFAVRRVNLPGCNLMVRLYSDAGGFPNALLATSNPAAGNPLPDSNPKWTCFTFDAPPVLAANTPYWAILHPDGVPGAAPLFSVLLDQSGAYPDGAVRYWNGAGWQPSALELQFRVAGSMETTEQIRLMAGGGYGQFLTGVQVNQASGVYTNPYRTGDRTALTELRQHLETGSSAPTRLLATVSADRRLVINAMPAESTAGYVVGRDGVIRLKGGSGSPPEGRNAAPPGNNLAGSWATVNTPWAINAASWGLLPGRMFLESVEWSGGFCRPAAD